MQCGRVLIPLAAALVLSAAAAAEETAVEDTAVEAAAEATVLELAAFDDQSSLTDEELGRHRARENFDVSEITINAQDQDGDVTDNVAIGTTNGDNVINGQAFSDASGFLSTVQNTGNNVLIQNSTIINVTVEASGN